MAIVEMLLSDERMHHGHRNTNGETALELINERLAGLERQVESEPDAKIICSEDSKDSILVKDGIRRLKRIKDLCQAKGAGVLVAVSESQVPMISPEPSSISAGFTSEQNGAENRRGLSAGHPEENPRRLGVGLLKWASGWKRERSKDRR